MDQVDDQLIYSSISSKILTRYMACWMEFQIFLYSFYGLSIVFPVKTEWIITFVTYLFLKNFWLSTIRTYKIAISFAHRSRSLRDHVSDSLLHILLAGVNCVKRRSTSRKQRKANNLSLSHRILGFMESSSITRAELVTFEAIACTIMLSWVF